MFQHLSKFSISVLIQSYLNLSLFNLWVNERHFFIFLYSYTPLILNSSRNQLHCTGYENGERKYMHFFPQVKVYNMQILVSIKISMDKTANITSYTKVFFEKTFKLNDISWDNPMGENDIMNFWIFKIIVLDFLQLKQHKSIYLIKLKVFEQMKDFNFYTIRYLKNLQWINLQLWIDSLLYIFFW